MSILNLVKSWSDYSGPHVNKLVKKRVEEANDKWQKLRLNLFSFPITLKLIQYKIYQKIFLVAANTHLLSLAYKQRNI